VLPPARRGQVLTQETPHRRVEGCPRCAGRRQLIATIDDPAVIQTSALPVPDSPVEGSHPVIQGPDLTSDPRSGRLGASSEGVYPRCATADPGGSPSGAVGHD